MSETNYEYAVDVEIDGFKQTVILANGDTSAQAIADAILHDAGKMDSVAVKRREVGEWEEYNG